MGVLITVETNLGDAASFTIKALKLDPDPAVEGAEVPFHGASDVAHYAIQMDFIQIEHHIYDMQNAIHLCHQLYLRDCMNLY